jgi:hypothetical protein
MVASSSNNNSEKQQQQQRIPLTRTENLAVGAVGGALETCLQMPVLTYKFCLQEGRALPTSIPGWYRGVAVQASIVAPITAIQFMCNGILQNAFLSLRSRNDNNTVDGTTTNPAPLSDGETILAAAGAGAISAIAYSPVDLLTIQQQKLQLDLWGTTKTVVQQYGFSGLYRGFYASVGREALYTAGYLGFAPVITARSVNDAQYLSDRPLMASIVGACTAGTLAAITTHPIDTAKTCIQSDMTGTTWTSTIGTMQTLVRVGGISSLYRGMVPRTVRLCGAFFVCLMVRDGAMKTRRYAEDHIPNNDTVVDHVTV